MISYPLTSDLLAGVATVDIGGVACAATGALAAGYAANIAAEKTVDVFLGD